MAPVAYVARDALTDNGSSMALGGALIEAWAQGFNVGGLIILMLFVVCNYRRGVILHKLIILEVCIVPAGDMSTANSPIGRFCSHSAMAPSSSFPTLSTIGKCLSHCLESTMRGLTGSQVPQQHCASALHLLSSAQLRLVSENPTFPPALGTPRLHRDPDLHPAVLGVGDGVELRVLERHPAHLAVYTPAGAFGPRALVDLHHMLPHLPNQVQVSAIGSRATAD